MKSDDDMAQEAEFIDYEASIVREMTVVYTETPKKFFLRNSGKYSSTF